MALDIRTEEAAKEVVERIGADDPGTKFVWRAALVFTTWTAINVGILGLLAAGTIPGGWGSFFALFALVMASMATLLHGFRDSAYPGTLRRVLVYRPFWYAQVSLFLLNVAGGGAFLIGLPFGRGLAWARGALAVEVVLLAVFFAAGWLGSRHLVVRRLTLAFPDLPAAFDGVTIAQLTDTHVGPHTNRRFLSRAARAAADAKPDLVAFTGDQVDDFDEDVRHFNAAFGHLPRAFAIAGNHDIYAGWDGVRSGLCKAGITVLVNDAVPMERGDETLWIAGAGDPAAGQRFVAAPHEAAPDIARMLASVPRGAFVVALAHNPALWPALAARGVQLTLSGHTHYGQVSIPALRWCAASPFLDLAMGLYERGNSKLYVAPGTGYWGLPLRLGAWPEVTIVRLVKAASSAS